MHVSIFGVVFIAVVTALPVENDYAVEFADFKQRFDRTYTGAEHTFRHGVFVENMKRLEQYKKDAEGRGYTVGITKFSDWTMGEKQKFLLSSWPGWVTGTNTSVPVLPPKRATPAEYDSLPEYKDWRQTPYMPEIKNQGGCGCCTSFATVATLEIQHAAKHNDLKTYSEQYLVDCVAGCDGSGDFPNFDYVGHHGIPFTWDYDGYHQSRGNCHGASKQYILCSLVHWSGSDIESMRKNLVEVGPIAFGMHLRDSFMHYNGGIYREDNSKFVGWHAMANIGYAVGSRNQQNTDYWIVRNQWGKGWGENGYVRIEMHKNAGEMETNDLILPNLC